MRSMHIKVKPSFFILPLLFYVGDKLDVFCLFMLSVLIHELSHLFILILKKIPVKEFCFSASGIKILRENKKITSYRDDIFIALSGPLGNFIVASGLFLIPDTGFKTEGYFYFLGINFLLFLFNMLPVSPLDGGIIFTSIMLQNYSFEVAEKISFGMAAGTIALLWGSGFYVLAKTGYNISLLCVAIFISVSFISPQGKDMKRLKNS